MKSPDLTNQKFGRLTVLRRDSKGNHKDSAAYWLCKCDCGNIKSIQSPHLIQQTTTSCGCGIGNRKKSIGEALIEKSLVELKISYQREYNFPDLKGDYKELRFDFFFQNIIY